ncbi:MAG TPA: hypothetical protein VEZ41_09980, partial [Allosphingosinicella sp.]|nr:hypothetical protein [Allosphingosinicella sp.]
MGTNLAILRLLWSILSGRLLESRGALFPALTSAGFSEAEARGAEAALRQGKFLVARLIEGLRRQVQGEKHWQPRSIAGYHPLVIDWVGFFRPRLRGCLSKHYDSQAGKALPAIELGLLVRIGLVREKRIPLLLALVRGGDTLSLLEAAKGQMRAQDVLIADRQVTIGHLCRAGIERFVVRAAVDFTARTKQIAPYGGRGRYPKQGSIVRPLPRRYRGKTIAATEPNRREQFLYQGRTLQVEFWDELVVEGCAVVFGCCVIRDPRYKTPWVLLTSLSVSGESLWRLYRDRWPIEQVPLAAKQMLGGCRSFVHSGECRHRLPELCLLAGAVSLYLAATCEPVKTGFWDRNPSRTPGRFRRALSRESLPDI